MDRYDRIISLLTKAFNPTRLELRDDSKHHAGHAGAQPGGQTHYDLVIESEIFKGMNKVQQHQAIYRVLAEELKSGLHALAIKATAKEE